MANIKKLQIGGIEYNIVMDGVEANAQVNVIETIKLNGAAVAVTNKTVDLGNLQKALTPGSGINIDANGTISTTLDVEAFKVMDTLPAAPATGNEGKIHVVPATGTTTEGNVYSEYLWDGSKWELLGEFKADVDLSDYYTKSEVDAELKKLEDAQTSLDESVIALQDWQEALTGTSTPTKDSTVKAEKVITEAGTTVEQELKDLAADIVKATGVTAGAYGDGTGGGAYIFGDVITIPYFTVDAAGRLTKAGTIEVTIPDPTASLKEGANRDVTDTYPVTEADYDKLVTGRLANALATALMNEIGKKANQTDLDTLANTVSEHSTGITALQNDFTDMQASYNNKFANMFKVEGETLVITT